MSATTTTLAAPTTVEGCTIDALFTGLDNAAAVASEARKAAALTVSDVTAVELVRAYRALDVLKTVSAQALAKRGKAEKRKGLGAPASWRTRARAGHLLSLPEGADPVDAVRALGMVREHGEVFGAKATTSIILAADDRSEAYADIAAEVQAYKAGLDPVEQAALTLKAAAERVASLVTDPDKAKPYSDKSRALVAEVEALLASLR